MKSINASMHDIVDDAEFAAETERRLERPLWGVAAIFGVAAITTALLQGALGLVVPLSVVFGFIFAEIVFCRHRRHRALTRAARFKKLLSEPSRFKKLLSEASRP